VAPCIEDGKPNVGGVPVKLGGFLDNTRRKVAKLTLERRTELDALGMRW
jgi:hypothetical protein